MQPCNNTPNKHTLNPSNFATKINLRLLVQFHTFIIMSTDRKETILSLFFICALISQWILLDQELISYCCCYDHFIKAQGSIISNRIGMKFGRIVPKANVHQFTEYDFRFDTTVSDGSHDVISREKCCHLVTEHEASAQRPCSSICQFLIYSTYVIVLWNSY